MSGGPLEGQLQLFFLTIEVAEIIPYRHAKPYEDMSFLTDLYLKKGVEAGIEIKVQAGMV